MVFGAARNLSVILTLNDRMSKQLAVARAQVDKFGKATTKTGTDTQKAFQKAGQAQSRMILDLRRSMLAWLAVAGAGIGIWAALVRASQQYKASITTLDGALQSVGTSWEDQKDRILDVIDALKQKTSFSDKDQLDALRRLVLLTGNFDTALGLLEPALGLAARTGLSVADAADLIAKILKGDDGAVEQAAALGFKFDDVTTAAGRMNAILEFTEGWASRNKDAYKDFTNELAEFQRVIAEEVLPTITPFIEAMTDFLEAVGNSSGAMDTIAASFNAILGPTKFLLDLIRRIVDFFENPPDITGGPWASAVDGLLLILSPLKSMLDGIMSVWRSLFGGEETTPLAEPEPIEFPGSEINEGAPPSAIEGDQGGPYPPIYGDDYGGEFEGIYGPPSRSRTGMGASNGGMSFNIISNGDLDFERRVRGQLDSIIRSGWRPNYV